MGTTLRQLYPSPAAEVPLRGLYLGHRLQELGQDRRPFVYADFVTSLDARIAVRDPVTGLSDLPQELTSPNDLRLLMELHAQADCLVTNAGYLRAVAEGRLDDILQVGLVRGHEDLADWREASGLRRQPAVCIVSASLDFRIPASLKRRDRQVFVVTCRNAPAARINALEAEGYEVVVTEAELNVEGRAVVEALARRRLRTAFLLAGPRLLDAALRDGVLARLYMTITHELLGGRHIHSLLEGSPLAGAGRLKLRALYLDSSRANGADQFFAHFEPLNYGAMRPA